MRYTNIELYGTAIGYCDRYQRYPRNNRIGKGVYENFGLDIEYGLRNNYGTKNGPSNMVTLKIVSFYIGYLSE